MPDLGQYSGPVLSAYAVGIVLITALTVLSLLRANRMRRNLKDIEARRKNNG